MQLTRVVVNVEKEATMGLLVGFFIAMGVWLGICWLWDWIGDFFDRPKDTNSFHGGRGGSGS